MIGTRMFSHTNNPSVLEEFRANNQQFNNNPKCILYILFNWMLYYEWAFHLPICLFVYLLVGVRGKRERAREKSDAWLHIIWIKQTKHTQLQTITHKMKRATNREREREIWGRLKYARMHCKSWHRVELKNCVENIQHRISDSGVNKIFIL